MRKREAERRIQMNTRKTTPWAEVTPEQRKEIAYRILDDIHDDEVEEEEIAEYNGFEFLAAMRGLAEELLK